jgi:enamine deaminase RidA (YjgF/YER057c/UK114 family)
MLSFSGSSLDAVPQWTKVVRVRISLPSLSTSFSDFNSEYTKHLPNQGRNPPCRATIGQDSSPLHLPLLSLPDDNHAPSTPTFPNDQKINPLIRIPAPLSVLHVQSISLWAPANIGPYSQAVSRGETVFLAGMIGLDPGSMVLVEGGIDRQADRAMASCIAVADCVVEKSLLTAKKNSDLDRWGCAVRWAVGVVYVTSAEDGERVRSRLPEELARVCCVAVVDQLPRKALVELLLVGTGPSVARSEPEPGLAGVSVISRWRDAGLSYTAGHGVVEQEAEGKDSREKVAWSLAQNGIHLDSHTELVIHKNNTYDFTRAVED